jgi:hypothetical protein
MCCCFLRFTYSGSQRNVPYVLGHETITSGLGNTAVSESASRRITFQDMYVIRNVPVKSDNLMMYMAFCRAKSSGFAKGLLNLFSDTANLLAGPVIGAAAKTSVDLTGRLAGLLGADGVETRFGIMSGNALTTSGYYVHAGIAASELSGEELEMRDGQLFRQNASGVPVSIDNVDYLVIALENRTSIVSPDFGFVSILPFHTRWGAARDKILSGDLVGAKAEMGKLQIEVAGSPDVTEADRLGVIMAYQSAYEEWSALKANGSLMGSSDGPRVKLLALSDRASGQVSEIVDLASRTLGLKDEEIYEARNKAVNVNKPLSDNSRKELDSFDDKALGQSAAWLVRELDRQRFAHVQVGVASRAITSSFLEQA